MREQTKMTARTVLSFASRGYGWLLPLLAAGACSPEVHIIASMDPDGAAGGMAGMVETGGMAGAVPEGPGQGEPARDCATGCCDDGVMDGDESDVDCGGSCTACADGRSCTVAADCTSAVCDAERCARPTCVDGVLNGAETDRDCGGPLCNGCVVGALCALPTDCQSGLCDPETHECGLNCTRGFAECDGDLGDPCETDILTSAANCGNCGTPCTLAHAASRCDGGFCAIDACATGFDDCDGDAANGCETSLSSANHCGTCTTACTETLGLASRCVEGRCVADSCVSGTADCNGMPADGCETSLTDDPDNCGRCGGICNATHATAACNDGECVGVCDAGWADCNANVDDGCESDVTSPLSCGSCGNVCISGEVCLAGDCVKSP